MALDPKERKWRSARQETVWARAVGGLVNPGSGSGWRKRQDVRTDTTLWEMKRTDNGSISIKVSDWNQLRHHALMEGREPAMHLEIGGYPDSASPAARRLVVMDEGDWLSLWEAAHGS